MRRTGLVWHERYMWHDTGSGTSELPSGGWLEPHIHAENPDPQRPPKNLLAASGRGRAEEANVAPRDRRRRGMGAGREARAFPFGP